MKKEFFAVVVFAVAVVGGWVWLEFRPSARTPSQLPATPPPGINVFADTTVLGRDWGALDGIRWEDIAPTAGFLAGQGLLGTRFLGETSEADRPEARYLRALLFMGRDEMEDALAEFRKIPPEDIPPAYLYAPWRVWSALAPGEENPFQPPFFAAADAGELPSLQVARADVARGRFASGLENYLRSNPAEWANFDLDNFRVLLAEEAFHEPTGAMLLAAMKAGSVAEPLRAGVARLLLDRPAEEDSAPALREFLSGEPEVLKVAEEVLRSLAEDRLLFVQEKFEALTGRHVESAESEQIDETVILLTIASSVCGADTEFFRWSQELRRRFPQPEVAQWIESLKNP